MRLHEPKMIVNVTRESVVCEETAIADRALTRMRGLLGRRALPSGQGLLLRPAPSIHTAFMRFPIDVVFLDADLRVVKLVPDLKPWRTASARGARAVLELAAGETARREISLADRLAAVAPAPPSSTSPSPAPGPPAEISVRIGSPARVLLVANDRRFRAVASALLTRRGYSVALGDRTGDLSQLASREAAEIVVIDATGSLTDLEREVTRLETLRPRVGVVAVSAEPEDGLAALPVISKWNSFDALFAAIENARPTNRRARVASGLR
jgi:uncharacterized membrane protein (UPF0127 family)